jgi:hypothetical protein
MSQRLNRSNGAVRLLLAAAMLLSFLVGFVVPSVGAAPDTVTGVNITAPTQAVPTYAKAGGSFTVNYAVTSNNAGTVEVQYALGATTVMSEQFAVVAGNNVMTKTVSVPAGFAVGRYDVQVCARELPFQTNYFCDAELQALVVDNTKPTVTLNTPNGGESWSLATLHNIAWAAADANLGTNPISLYLSMDGGATWPTMIATGLPNTSPYPWNVGGGMGTTCKVKVVVRDRAGNENEDVSNANFTIYGTDNTAPVVTLIAPAAGAAPPGAPTYIRGPAYAATGTAVDPESGIANTQFSYSTDSANWALIGAGVFGAGQYAANWNTTLIPDGTRLSAKFEAQNGQGASTSDRHDNIVVDNSAPTVSLAAPDAGAFIGGQVNVGATAADTHSGIVRVTFEFSPTTNTWGAMAAVAPTVNPDPASPFAINWNTVGLPEGPAKLRAKADNGAGAQTTSAVVNVTIDNTPPAMTAPVIGRPLAGAVWQIGSTGVITWRTAAITDLNLADNPISLFYSSNEAAPWTLLADGLPNNGTYSWILTGLVPSANYRVQIRAADKAGNQGTADSGLFTIWGQDTTPPIVNLTAPANGAWFNGGGAPVPLAANAADVESGIQSVTFFSKQGVGAWTQIGAPDTTAPYGVNWPVAGLNGQFQLMARALNGVGMTTDSAAVTVNVDSTVPVVTLDQPAADSTIWGQAYELKATATDAQSGITKVEFFYWDANALPAPKWVAIGTDTTAPYAANWDTSALPDGWYDVKAKATNGVGAISEDTNEVEIDNTYEINLLPGWNLISLPVIPYNTSITALLADLVANGSVKQVATFVWEGGALVQKIWVPGFPSPSLTEMKDGQGYWVEMNQAGDLMVQGLWAPGPGQPLPEYVVSTGWNMIGYTPMGPEDVKTVTDYLSPDLGNTISAMYGFDPATKLYENMVGDDILDYGEGYWLAVTAPGKIFP